MKLGGFSVKKLELQADRAVLVSDGGDVFVWGVGIYEGEKGRSYGCWRLQRIFRFSCQFIIGKTRYFETGNCKHFKHRRFPQMILC